MTISTWSTTSDIVHCLDDWGVVWEYNKKSRNIRPNYIMSESRVIEVKDAIESALRRDELIEVLTNE